MDKIRIDKLVVFGKHGVFKEENALGQKFEVSLVLYTDTRKAGLTDELEYSINYGEVCHLVQDFFDYNTFKLIEKVAEELAQLLLLTFPLLQMIDVKIEKPWAPVAMPVENLSVEIRRGWHTAFIALGSNMGDTKGYLDDAVKKLSEHSLCEVISVADYIETEPYGGVEQDKFLNSALELKTLLLPEELLDLLNQFEIEANRERLVHWGPRTLDLDILFYDDCIIDSNRLHVPHIDLQNRDFVLIPMAQIAPYLRHPVLNCTIQQLLEALKKSSNAQRYGF